MIARPWRAILALALAPWLFGSSVLPQEHVHEADADHPHALVHRHLEAHQFDSHDHDGPEIDHDDDAHVVWLSDVPFFLSTYHLDTSPAVAGRSFEAIRDAASWIPTASDNAVLPHGPPRPRGSPRAPPRHTA